MNPIDSMRAFRWSKVTYRELAMQGRGSYDRYKHACHKRQGKNIQPEKESHREARNCKPAEAFDLRKTVLASQLATVIIKVQ